MQTLIRTTKAYSAQFLHGAKWTVVRSVSCETVQVKRETQSVMRGPAIQSASAPQWLYHRVVPESERADSEHITQQLKSGTRAKGARRVLLPPVSP